MKNIILNNNYQVYPGTYVPLMDEKGTKAELRILRRHNKNLPSMNMTEMHDVFKVEVVAPGAKREEFIVHSNGNMICIGLIHHEQILQKEKTKELNSSSGFESRIVLPKNADPEFISAEYKEGILRLLIPKSTHKTKKHHTTIVVY